MKTYPYHTPEGIIELVDKRELDQLLEELSSEKSTRNTIIAKGVKIEQANAELIERLAEARESYLHASARDVQTIQRQAVMLERLASVLALITEEYEDRRFQFSDDRLWQKHEGNNPLPTAFAALDAYESANFEPVNPIDEAVKRMEEVPVQELDKIWDDAPGGSALVGFEAVRTRLIQAAKGEQP
jgi:hypothetical protein